MGLHSEIRILIICYPTPNPIFQLFHRHLNLSPLLYRISIHPGQNINRIIPGARTFFFKKKLRRRKKRQLPGSRDRPNSIKGSAPPSLQYAAPNNIRALHQRCNQKKRPAVSRSLPNPCRQTRKSKGGGKSNPIRSDPIPPNP